MSFIRPATIVVLFALLGLPQLAFAEEDSGSGHATAAMSANTDALTPPSPQDSKAAEAAGKKLTRCFFRSIAVGDSKVETMTHCIDVGVAWCNATGVETHVTGYSTVTGIPRVDNFKCSGHLLMEHNSDYYVFNEELEIYTSSDGMGMPYTPNAFDIRPFLALRGAK